MQSICPRGDPLTRLKNTRGRLLHDFRHTPRGYSSRKTLLLLLTQFTRNGQFQFRLREPVANCVSQRDPIQFLNRDSLLDEEKKEGRKGWVKIIRKKKRKERKEKKVWSAIRRVQFDVGCDRARPSIRNSRRGNKSSRKTCELVPCHQLWSVAIARRNIASNWEEREEGGIVLHAESACNERNGERGRDPVPRGFLC